MRTVNKISKRINQLSTENFLVNRRVINFNTSVEGIWLSAKRFAH